MQKWLVFVKVIKAKGISQRHLVERPAATTK